MSTLSGKSKVPMLLSQGVSDAKWGRWVDGFASFLTRKGLHLFAALDTPMPTEYPELDEDEDDKESLELANAPNLQWKVTNKYEFAAKSAEAYALLYTKSPRTTCRSCRQRAPPRGDRPGQGHRLDAVRR